MPNQNSLWVLLTVTGELDMSRTDELDEMVAAIDRDGPADIIVDLTEVTFMDSSALRWFLNLQQRMEGVPGKLRLVAKDEGSFARLISLSGLEGRFEVFPTTVEAFGSSSDLAGSSDAGATDKLGNLLKRIGKPEISSQEPLTVSGS